MILILALAFGRRIFAILRLHTRILCLQKNVSPLVAVAKNAKTAPNFSFFHSAFRRVLSGFLSEIF